MKLVIDIPEEDFERCKKRYLRRINIMGDAIANGIPLPEGHGRLGDLDELEHRITRYVEQHAHMMDEMVLLQENFIIDGIKETPTIIEADRAESEKEEKKGKRGGHILQVLGRSEEGERKMTIQGAIHELEQMLSRTDIPGYIKPTIKKVIETTVDEFNEQRVIVKDGVLDKIRAEIENDWRLKKFPSSPFSCGLRRTIEIIDKYKAESEEALKAQSENNEGLKREFLRMASYIDVILECSDAQKETLLGFVSRLAEFMP